MGGLLDLFYYYYYYYHHHPPPLRPHFHGVDFYFFSYCTVDSYAQTDQKLRFDIMWRSISEQ